MCSTLRSQRGFVKKLNALNDTFGKKAMFYGSCRKMFKSVLLFLGVTKQRFWLLCLSSFHVLIKYFFHTINKTKRILCQFTFWRYMI